MLSSPDPLFPQLATVGAGVDVVKVVERQPALLLVDDSSPLSDWSQLDPEELQQQIQVDRGGGGHGRHLTDMTHLCCTAHKARGGGGRGGRERMQPELLQEQYRGSAGCYLYLVGVRPPFPPPAPPPPLNPPAPHPLICSLWLSCS